MWNSCNKLRRLNAAINYRGLNAEEVSIPRLGELLIKRGITDKSLDGIVWTLISILEPPGCQRTHCESFTTCGFCYCSKGLLPNKCMIHRKYMSDRRKRATVAADKLLKELDDHCKKDCLNSISVYRKKDCLNITSVYREGYKFHEDICKIKKFAYVRKWNYNLREDVWKEIKKRVGK